MAALKRTHSNEGIDHALMALIDRWAAFTRKTGPDDEADERDPQPTTAERKVVIETAVAEDLAYLATLGDLHEWRVRHDAERHAEDLVNWERARNASLWARQGYPAKECWARGADGPPGLDAESQALVDDAEAWPEARREARDP